MLAAELPAQTKRAVTEGAAARKGRAEIGGLGAGASGSEPREAAITEIGDCGGDEGPAVASGSSTGDAGGAPGGPGLLLIGVIQIATVSKLPQLQQSLGNRARSGFDRAATPPEMPEARKRRTW